MVAFHVGTHPDFSRTHQTYAVYAFRLGSCEMRLRENKGNLSILFWHGVCIVPAWKVRRPREVLCSIHPSVQ